MPAWIHSCNFSAEGSMLFVKTFYGWLIFQLFLKSCFCYGFHNLHNMNIVSYLHPTLRNWRIIKSHRQSSDSIIQKSPQKVTWCLFVGDVWITNCLASKKYFLDVIIGQNLEQSVSNLDVWWTASKTMTFRYSCYFISVGERHSMRKGIFFLSFMNFHGGNTICF